MVSWRRKKNVKMEEERNNGLKWKKQKQVRGGRGANNFEEKERNIDQERLY